MRQTYGLYGTVVILRMLGTRPEQHRTHNFGWLLAFEGSLFGGMSGPSRFLPCLCGTEYNTNRRCYYMVVLLFRRAIRGAGRRGKREPQSVPALNRDRPLIGTSPSYCVHQHKKHKKQTALGTFASAKAARLAVHIFQKWDPDAS